MSVFQHAHPALLYLVPGVLISLWGTALVRGEVKEMWEFSEALTGEQIEEETEGEKKEAGAQEEKSPKGLFERLWQEIWTGSEKKEPANPDKSSSTSAKSMIEQSKAETNEKRGKNDDLLFSFSIARHNTNSANSSKLDNADTESNPSANQAHSPSRSETSDDAVVVSPDDMDGTTDPEPAPRYRTRSTHKGETDGGVAL